AYGGVFGAAGAQLAGNAIAVDSTGKADIAMKLTDSSGNEEPAFSQAPANGRLTRFFFFTSMGPGGSMNGVGVDPANSAYYTGPSMDPSSGNIDFLVAAIAANGTTQIYGFGYGASGANFVTYDNKVGPDGTQYVVATADDGSGDPGTHGWLYAAVIPTGDML